MDSKIADRLKAEYDYLWDNSMIALPDGWTEPGGSDDA
ncbi:hypothetical protein HNR29_004881 [Rhizobium leguminosarum]|nr:hypothetical protein [Rhizobium leguminosarum]